MRYKVNTTYPSYSIWLALLQVEHGYLMRRDLRRQDDAFVVTVGHEECTQETRRDTPRRRMHQRALALFVLEVHLAQGDKVQWRNKVVKTNPQTTLKKHDNQTAKVIMKEDDRALARHHISVVSKRIKDSKYVEHQERKGRNGCV